MVWGGRRLGERLHKPLPDAQLYGESWEVSDHSSYASFVANGPLAGISLRELMTNRRTELLGQAADKYSVFPWLVKYLDCHDWLSVQVHPNDELVKKWWPGEGGKTEVWFILEAQPGSRVYAGLLPGVDEKTLRAALAKGTVAECLHSFEPQAGDSVFLPAGTVHAVGGGVLMAEIQQTSDATFRLFDWNRVDTQGKSRTLHIEEALACIDWKAGPVRAVHANGPRQTLATCPFFQLEYWSNAGEVGVGGQNTLHLLIPTSGAGKLLTAQGPQAVQAGQVWVLPADLPTQRCISESGFACLICTLPI